MPECATCGQENPEGFAFCGRCGARLAFWRSVGATRYVRGAEELRTTA